MASFRKRGKVWYFRYTDADGVKREAKGCPDRRMTEEMAREAESKAARQRAGLIDPKAERLAVAERRPILDHLDDFIAALTAKGGDPKHVRQTRTYASRIIEWGAIRSISEVAPSTVMIALGELKAENRSARTLNAHLTAIRQFSRWLHRDGRSLDNPLAGMSKFSEAADRRHDRRTLSVEELRKLIESAHRGESYRKMTGPARALCYRLAVATGLRFSELASITPGSFDLDSKSPTVTVAAAYTKNGEPATLPLPHDLAEDLAPHMATIAPEAPAFPLPDKGAAMLRIDLEAAGIAYRDDSGLVFDFHALRCQCATLADAAGVSPRVVQRLMRHSTLELTGRYTRPRTVDLEQAARSIPSIRPESPERDSARATGTDGQPISERFAHYLPTEGDGSSRPESDAVATLHLNGAVDDRRKEKPETGLDASGRDESASVTSASRRTRTFNPLIKSQLLCRLS